MKITRSNTWYVVELRDSKLHILNRKALLWNLTRIFKVSKREATKIVDNVDISGFVEIAA